MQNIFLELRHSLMRASIIALITIAFGLVFQSSPLTAQNTAQDAADTLAATASNAQNAEEYELAAGQWLRLIKEYPDYKQMGKAYLNLGDCQLRMEDFGPAIGSFENAINKLPQDQADLLAGARLYLGFCQARVGRDLKTAEKEKSQRLLTTSTETLASLIRTFPEFKRLDEAYFFQGEAFEDLERLDRAEEAYTKSLEFDKPTFRLDGLKALGYVQDKLGKYVEAQKTFEVFEVEGSDDPAINEVRMVWAESMKKMAMNTKELGDEPRATNMLKLAMAKFAKVADAGEPFWADQALMSQADCANELGDYKMSAKLYEAAMQIPKSKFVDKARVAAGRDHLESGNGNRAAELLEKAVTVESAYAPEAAHWLTQLYLKSGQNDKAFATADQWIAKTKEQRVLVPLMLGRADAAYATAARRPESEAMYLKIFDLFPQHKLAQVSLYNAAFAAKETQEFDRALGHVQRFEKAFEGGDYLPSVLEVKGDCLFLKKQPQSAGDVFAGMIDKFPGHPKTPKWKLNTGLAKYMESEFSTVIEILDPLTAQLSNKSDQAEALHWIGSSHFRQKQLPEAIAALRQSHNTDSQWRRADETLLTLAQAYQQSNQPEEALKWTTAVRDQFPNSPLLAETAFRTAEFNYKNKKYDNAIKNYADVIAKYGQSGFAPHAKYGTGWSQMKRGKFSKAAEAFTSLIKDHPDHDRATDALVGRASAHRQSGDPDKAIADVKKFLESKPEGKIKTDATYEMGLAQIDKKDWPSVTATFTELLELDATSELADQFHYELAWAKRSLDKQDESLAHFTTIANKFPASKHAAESNFHVAQNLYKQEKFSDALPFYQAAVKTSNDSSITEKAMHKMAWTHYKAGDFGKANSVFRDQVAKFSEGSKLYADGLFMVSETYYENKQHEEALEAYRVAKPVLETSQRITNNRLLNLLHGAQVANKVKNYKEAITFAEPLLEMEIDKSIKQDAQLQIGDARRGLKEDAKALTAYEQASFHPGATGARASCMMGDLFFTQKNFQEAIDKYKLVGFGYGGSQAAEDVKGWQAYATYEVARCYYVQIGSAADPALKQKFTDESVKYFKLLIEKYPNDRLAEQAKSELKKLGAK